MSAMSSGIPGARASGGERAVRDDVDAIRADLNALKGDLRNLVSDSAHAAKAGASVASERISQAAEHAQHKAKEAFHAAKAKGLEATEAIEGQIEEHPFLSVGIAFGVGLLVGALISRK